MEWTFRTVVRIFMFVVGSYFLVSGLVTGDVLEVALGIAGVVLGAAGLAGAFGSNGDEQ